MHLTSLQLKTRFEQCSGLYYAQQADEHGHEASMGILCPVHPLKISNVTWFLQVCEGLQCVIICARLDIGQHSEFSLIAGTCR